MKRTTFACGGRRIATVTTSTIYTVIWLLSLFAAGLLVWVFVPFAALLKGLLEARLYGGF